MELFSTALTQAQQESLVSGFVGGFIASILVGALVIYVLMIIANWKIFTKAGEKGWKSLIPIYNMVIMFRIVGMSPWWVLITFLVAMLPAFAGVNVDPNTGEYIMDNVNAFGIIIVTLVGLFCLFISIYYSIRLAKVFGKGAGFTVGLILLSSIFWLILAFGSAEYDKKALKS